MQTHYAQRAQERMQQMVVRRLMGEPVKSERPQVKDLDESREAQAKVEGLKGQA